MDAVCQKLVPEEIKNFDEFHIAMLEVITAFNAGLPGIHYEVPGLKEVEGLYDIWKRATDKKKAFIEFMEKNVKLSRADNTTMFAGILMPPAAMAAKKAGENVPQLNIIKNVPDVLFVPSATVLALISVKVSRRLFIKSKAPES